MFDQGFQVNVINPIQLDAVRNLFLRKTKSDAKGSFLIAETIHIGRFSNTALADEAVLALRQLFRHRMDLVDCISDQKRKIIGVMNHVFPEYQHFFKNMFGKTSAELLSAAVNPEELLAIPTNELCVILKKASRGRFGEAKAEEIRAAAQSTFGITIATSPFAMQLRQLLEMIDLLERQLDELDFEIEQRMNKLDTCITTCPGVGKVLGGVIGIFLASRSRRSWLPLWVLTHLSISLESLPVRRTRCLNEARPICSGRFGWPLLWQRSITPCSPLFTRKSAPSENTIPVLLSCRTQAHALYFYAVLRDNKPYVPIC